MRYNVVSQLKKHKLRLFYYLTGFLVIGFAVNIIKASDLGNGAWDTVSINLRDFFHLNLNITWVTMGMFSFLISFTLMLIVISYRKKYRYLLMVFPILFVALSIDFWNFTVFHDYESSILWIQFIFFILGLFILPLGLSLIVKSDFPAFVFEELMLMFVKISKAKKITYVRLSIELTGITIGAIFGYLTYYHLDQSLGAVNIGSMIITVFISPIMNLYFKALKISN